MRMLRHVHPCVYLEDAEDEGGGAHMIHDARRCFQGRSRVMTYHVMTFQGPIKTLGGC